jgi:dipeptidyl aminopeptidase/acylaminoacyl peptidase
MAHAENDLKRLLGIPWVDPDYGFDISPDGGELTYSWNATGQWEIYTLSLSNETGPIRITTGGGGKYAPRWRPDGKGLAYARDDDGSENYEIYLWEKEIGEHRNLTPKIAGAISPFFSWSPDCNRIAFCSNQDGKFDTYILDLLTGGFHKALDLPHPDFAVSWSPDGNYLAVVSESKGQDFRITIVPLCGKEPYPITMEGTVISARQPAWSSDSRRILFSSDAFERHGIAVYDLVDHRITWLEGGDQDRENPVWLSNDSVVFVESKGPKSWLAVARVVTGEVVRYRLSPGVVYVPKVHPSRKSVYFIYDNPCNPDDLWSLSLEGETFHQLTHSLPDEYHVDDVCWCPQEIEYPGYLGENVPALLYLPKDAAVRIGPVSLEGKLPPAVIYIHGGPNWLAQYTWNPSIQSMIEQGWVVLAPNYRGSTGYGRKWQLQNRYDLGGGDLLDVVAGADYLIQHQLADPKRIGITGRSWGGYLTVMAMVNFPEKWAAGSAVVPFMNWFTAHQNSRDDLRHWDIENFGDPVHNEVLWRERSPFFSLDRVEAPIQMICGSQDVRCPVSESYLAYQKLVGLGKRCELICYQGEGHTFAKNENQVTSALLQNNFLKRYLSE